jgi:hypothetical protein
MATPLVAGRIGEVYTKAGGVTTLGAPLADEVQVVIGGKSTYGQRFEHGQVWYGSGVGKVDIPNGARVRLDTGRNFRPTLGVRDVWRTDDLDGCTPLEQRILLDLGIRTVVAMNSGSDPHINGVQNLRYEISNSGSHDQFYRGYVSRSGSRKSVGLVVKAVARSTHPILLHCHGGKDRTGWLCNILGWAAGVKKADRDTDYLATKHYTGSAVSLSWLNAARDELATRYRTMDRYLAACGVDAATLALLKERVA